MQTLLSCMFDPYFGLLFFFSSRRRHTRYWRDWSSDVCSSDLSAAQRKPTIGEIKSDLPMFAACTQSTPLVPVRAAINGFAMPTPIIEPISVCELEAGKPKYHVPRLHNIAATSSANTIATPTPLPT